MKTIKFISAALFVLAATACNSDYILNDNQSAGLEPMTLFGTETKTALNSADGSVNWTSGDQISIYDNLGGQNIFNNTAENVSSFSGNVKAGTTRFWGIYPAGLVKGFSNGTATVDLPSDQTPVAGTFAEDLNISVTCGSKTPGTEAVEGIRFHNVCGLISFTVPANIAANKVTFTSDKTAIAGRLSINCETGSATVSEYQNYSVSMTGDFAAGSTFYFVVSTGNIEGFRIDVETKAGSYYYKSASNGTINVEAGSLTNLGPISFKDGAAGASADHTYSNGTLTGSSLTVTHGIPENMWKDVTELKVSVEKGGAVYRSCSQSGITSADPLTPVGKTYLPQGTYTVNIDYKMNGVTTRKTTSVNVPAPAPTAFAITSTSGTTSYSLASSGKVAEANSHAAETVSKPTVTFTGISAAVLAEVNASCTFSVNGKQTSGTTSGTSYTGDDLTGLSWGSHTLTATVTFDGVNAAAADKGSSECHITGLPYDYNFVNGSLNNYKSAGWTLNGSLEVSNKSLAGRSKTLLIDTNSSRNNSHGYIVSPRFIIPANADIYVQPSIVRSVYRSSGDKSRTGYVGPVSNVSTSSTAITYTTNGGNSTSGSIVGKNTWLNSFALNASTPYVSVDSDKRSEIGWSYYFLHEVHLRYAE